MQTSDWIRIAAPFVTFFLGLVTAAILQYSQRKRSIVAWGIISEDSLFTQNVATDIDMPVQILIDGKPHDALTVVRLRLGSAGNEVLDHVACAVSFNESAKIFRVKTVDDLGEFRKTISFKKDSGRIEITFAYLNPEHRQIDFEILFGNYDVGSISVDLARKGTQLQYKETGKWDVQLSVLEGLALSFAGVRYDPTVSPLSEIAQELRNIKALVSSEQTKADDPKLMYSDSQQSSDSPLQSIGENKA